MAAVMSGPSPGARPAEGTAARYQRYYVLLLLWLVFTTSVLDRYLMGILAQPLKRDLGLSDAMLGALSGAVFGLFYATLGIPIARLADRTNRRNLIVVALSLWSVFTMACGVAANTTQLALARMLVGVGEAGSSPPSHAIIADLFPVKQRGRALGFFMSGLNFGLLLALVLGGFLGSRWGWRMAFIMLGAPGLVLSLVVLLTLEEPPRGLSDRARPRAEGQAWPGFGEVVGFILHDKALVHMYSGATLASLCGSMLVLWMPAFLIRAHGVDVGRVGLELGLMFGALGFFGTLLTGWLSDKLGNKDVRWRIGVPVVTQLLIWPCVVGALLAPSHESAVALLVLPGLLSAACFGPVAALGQTLAPLPMRATVAAIGIFALNFVGLVIGPPLIGGVSDLLAGTDPVQGLRSSLLLFSLAYAWSAVHFGLSARNLARHSGVAGGGPRLTSRRRGSAWPSPLGAPGPSAAGRSRRRPRR